MDPLALFFGLVLGAAIGGLFAASRYRGQLAAEQARREDREASAARERELFENQLAEMKTT